MKFVPCITWIKRGASKEMPEKIRLTKEELKEFIEEHPEHLAVEDENEDDDDDQEMESEDVKIKAAKVEDDGLGQYNLDNYDDDDGPSTSASGLKGLMCFSTNDVDPYMTKSDDEDDSDIEDIQIKPNDNLIAFGVVDEECNNVEFHVYNENENQFFAHHDILLPTMPLCMEWLDYETEDDKSNKGNYLAVGGMSPAIEVWDIDLVDCLEPAFVLGGSKKKKSKTQEGHTEAVLDLAWNSHVRNILASGSADFTVALWDMSNGKVVTKLSHFSEKVQSLKWHPFEPQHLLIGSCDEFASLVDCRDPEVVAKKWKCDGEVEKVIWNNLNPFFGLASTDKGYVHCIDARTDKILWTLSAHLASCTGLCLSSQCPGFLTTASVDEKIKVWDILDNEPKFVHESKLKLGKLYSLAASPDSPFVVCAGGDGKSNNYKLINLMSYSAVKNRFQNRELIVPSVRTVTENEVEAENEHSVTAMEQLNIKQENHQSCKKNTQI